MNTSKRVADYTSTTSAELHAVYEGLLVASLKDKDHQLSAADHIVEFMWLPSHTGICLNDTADELAKEALSKDCIDAEATVSFSRIKGVLMRTRIKWDFENIPNILDNGSECMQHCVTVYESTNVCYGRASTTVDTVVMRLRVGYKYCWQFVNGGDGMPCKLCNAENFHSLQHYLCSCPAVEEFRNPNITGVTVQLAI